MTRTQSLVAAGLLLALIPACAQGQDDEAERADAGAETGRATEFEAAPAGTSSRAADTVEIVGGDGEVIGQVELLDGSGGLLIEVRVEGLEPGLHGLHIHETGRCEPPDFASAGGHWAPDGNAHGYLAEGGPHAGDLPNLSVAAGPAATVQHVFARGLSLGWLREGDGSALLIHAGEDDYRSQPAGAAGARIACAAITGADGT